MAKEEKVSKVDRAYQMFQELKAQGLKPKEIYEKTSQELGISVHSARGYVWRAKNPEKYKALLERYNAKKNMKSKSRPCEESEKEILLRMAQSLQSEVKAQPKGMTDVGPYAKQYNFLRERVINIVGQDSQTFLPELSEYLIKYGWVSDFLRRVKLYDEIVVAINQLVSFLETRVKDSFRILTDLEEYLYNNLRKNIREKPRSEKDIQNVIEIMLNSRGYAFKREKTRISYSNKHYIPDFTFEDQGYAFVLVDENNYILAWEFVLDDSEDDDRQPAPK